LIDSLIDIWQVRLWTIELLLWWGWLIVVLLSSSHLFSCFLWRCQTGWSIFVYPRRLEVGSVIAHGHGNYDNVRGRFAIQRKIQITRTERIKCVDALTSFNLGKWGLRWRASEIVIVSVSCRWLLGGNKLCNTHKHLPESSGGLCRWCRWCCRWKDRWFRSNHLRRWRLHLRGGSMAMGVPSRVKAY
jgi:hypothetical protein